MKPLTDKEAEQHGIHTSHHKMENGELRFRLTCESGSSYILTQSTVRNGWQRAHLHLQKQEHYIVERGFALLALWENGQLHIRKLTENESVSVPTGVAHSVRMCDHAVMHTVKFGTADTDWHACEELDRLLEDVDITPFLSTFNKGKHTL